MTCVTVDGVTKSCTQWDKTMNYSRGYTSNLLSKKGMDRTVCIIRDRLKLMKEKGTCHPEKAPFYTITVNNMTMHSAAWSVYLGYNRGYISKIIRKEGEEQAAQRIKDILAGNYKANSHCYYKITVRGETKTAAQWSFSLNHHKDYVGKMIRSHGMDYAVKRIEMILDGEIPPKLKRSKFLTIDGEKKYTTKWSEQLGYKSNYINMLMRDKGEAAAVDFVRKQLKKSDEERKPKVNLITVGGRTQSAYKWAKEIGCCANYISVMIRDKGIDAATAYVEKHITNNLRPNYQVHRLTVDGVTKTAAQWDDVIGAYRGCVSKKAKKLGDDAAIKFIKQSLEGTGSPVTKHSTSKITINEITKCPSEWSIYIGRSRNYLGQIIRTKGMDTAVKIVSDYLKNENKT